MSVTMIDRFNMKRNEDTENNIIIIFIIIEAKVRVSGLYLNFLNSIAIYFIIR